MTPMSRFLYLIVIAVLCGASKQEIASPPESAPDLLLAQRKSAPASGAEGRIEIRIASVAGRPLPGKVELHGNGRPLGIAVARGEAAANVPAGSYKAHIFVYEEGIPLLVNVVDVKVAAGKSVSLKEDLLEGTSGNRLLREFDRDFDLAIDRAELAAGTDMNDPTSIPGRPVLNLPEQPVLSKKGQWYRGELHAQSKYGRGKESVGELVRRAEALGLDFLAICDPNTLAAARDPEFKSSKVVLIPAMAWGDDERGYALIYNPRTLPDKAENHNHAQAVSRLVQAQGGVFAAAHPCFPGMTWQWYVPYVNAIQVWAREWGQVPPIALSALDQDLQMTARDGKLYYSIAAAANERGLSANGQAALFWDYELVRGRKIAAIAGSMSGSPNVPLGQPITYVWAEEKSVRGIVSGIAAGRTCVAADMKAPRIFFTADAMGDAVKYSAERDPYGLPKRGQIVPKKVDVGIGGAVPVGVSTNLLVSVVGGKGKKVEVLSNGLPILSKIIEEDDFTVRIPQHPSTYAAYRARVIDAPVGVRFGGVKVLAMTSPIYAEGIVYLPENVTPENLRIQVQDESTAKSPYVPKVYVSGVGEGEGGEIVKVEKSEDAVLPLDAGGIPDPRREPIIELRPQPLN